MCTGRMDPALVAKAFKQGLDGCYFGDCHYISGNVQAKVKMDMTRRLFEHIGVNPERLAFRQCSSGEASVFVDIVNRFVADIRRLGPLGEGGDRLGPPEIFKKLEVATAVLAGEKIRWMIGKHTPFLESGNNYGEIFTEHEFNRAIDMIIVEETEVQEIMGQLRTGSQSVKDLAAHLGIPSERVLRYMLALMRKGMVTLKTVRQRTPIYQSATLVR